MSVETAAAAGSKKTVYLADYRPWPFRLDHVDLHLDIHDGHTVVSSALALTPMADADVLELNGVGLALEYLAIDGKPLSAGDYRIEGERLLVTRFPSGPFVLASRVRIHPENNTALEGLYVSGGMYCTQCEAEGFRKITWYPDRPDVMARFTTTLEADAGRYPQLLSNGNPVASGKRPGGRHFVTWEDPFPKPAYLFAAVAGKLSCSEDSFVTASGRAVALRIYVEPRDADKVGHAMDSLKRAMRWDELRYGREYDLDIFMIVAVSHFNMGAMENKGLNIFNTSCVLAHPATTTDAGFQRVESVVAHEYFHNWSGNRVTCRDWFQLSLKEGFTVFRDQQFSADMLSASVQRIEDVNFLRAWQFAEDAGPLAHPVRPESFVEINNFYTATVYEKGAEIVRMLHTVLGEERFRRGTDLYFSRHDGQAVTVEDFVAALGEGGGQDVSAFLQWYRQPGTPILHVRTEYDPARAQYRVHLRQELPEVPGYPAPACLPVPVRLALLAADGSEMQAIHAGVQSREHVLVQQEAATTHMFEGVHERPVLSVLRDFSAPVRLVHELSPADQYFLLRHDGNGFSRWRVAQDLYVTELSQLAQAHARGEHLRPSEVLLGALADMLPALATRDAALAAKLMQLPGVQQLIDLVAMPVPASLQAARQCLRHALARRLEDWLQAQCALGFGQDYQYSAPAMAARALAATALSLLVDLDPRHGALAQTVYQSARHMTDRQAALAALVHAARPEAVTCLEDFARQWQDEALVMDQWFALQATVPQEAAVETVRQLLGHADFRHDN
ncbi:MAG: aminopeptidase N, partial [Moraxellaceae bacterium]